MITLPTDPLLVFMMVLLRVGFILGFFPLLGERFVPVRIRVLMAVVVSLALTPVAGIVAAQFPPTMPGVMLMVLAEMLLGMSIGLIGRLVFAIVQFSGQIAGEQMGFGLVNAIDPTGSHQISVVAEMQYVLSIFIFFTADLHHGVLRVLTRSFSVLPPGGAQVNGELTDFMMALGSTLYEMSVGLAMPVIIIIFAINVALGMIARAVPQVNVFLESFPLRIIAGISIIAMSLGYLAMVWADLLAGMENAMGNAMQFMRG